MKKKAEIKKINNKKKREEKLEEYYKNRLFVLKMEIDKKDEEIKKYKEEFVKMKDSYEKDLKIIKEKNLNNIKKFENYLKILDKRINYEENEISIIYKINENENYVKIFDEEFVKQNKTSCKILYNGYEYELQENINVENINKNSEILEIKLKVYKHINFYRMFYKCKSLLYLPDISKFDTSNITNMTNMFYNCFSLLFLPDISKWNTNNVKYMDEMFDGCSSLMFLPDISKWDISSVIA